MQLTQFKRKLGKSAILCRHQKSLTKFPKGGKNSRPILFMTNHPTFFGLISKFYLEMPVKQTQLS